jgi:hypothetical protein
MAKQFLTPIDLSKNELLNPRAQNLASAPSSPGVGQWYFDTTLLATYTWNGTAWISADASKVANGSIPLSKLATDPLARANHTGTQLAGTISDLATVVQGYRLNQFAVPNGNIAMGGFTLTGLGTPTAAGQAAEYSWVLSQIQASAAGIDAKPSVNAVATTNQATLSGLAQTIDGVALSTAGMRVLLVGQTTATQNGPWVVQSGAWVRPPGETVTPQAFWMVESGTANSGTQWKVSTTGTITLGTTPLTIVQFGASSAYTSGNGLQLNGNVFSILNPAASGLSVSGSGISLQLDTNSGLVLGSGGVKVLTPANSGLTISGTGIALDTTIAVRKYAADVGDGSAITYVITHNLNTQDVTAAVYRKSGSFDVVGCDIEHTSLNTVTLRFAVAPSAAQFRVVVQG